MGKMSYDKIIKIIAIAICAVTLILSLFSGAIGAIYCHTQGDPKAVLTGFFGAIESGDYEVAYSYLAEYKDMHLEDNDEDGQDKRILEALKASYKAVNVGEVTKKGLNAKSKVDFRYLNIEALKNEVESEIPAVLEEYVDKLSRSEIYNNEGGYLQTFLEKVYDATVAKVIENNSDIYEEKTLEVELTYIEDDWKILVNQELIGCFLGGKAN